MTPDPVADPCPPKLPDVLTSMRTMLGIPERATDATPVELCPAAAPDATRSTITDPLRFITMIDADAPIAAPTNADSSAAINTVRVMLRGGRGSSVRR